MDQGLKILQCNVQSLSQHKAEIQRALVQGGYEIALLSETWTNEALEQTRKYHISNYHFIAQSRHDNYGGVAIFLQQDLNYRKVHFPSLSDFTQICGVSILSLDLIVISIYISPSIPSDKFGEDINKILDSLRPYSRILLGGDINAHHHLWGNDSCDSKGDTFLDAVNGSGLILLNSGDRTYIPIQLNRRSTSIDVTLCSANLFLDAEWNVLDFSLGSHHMAIETKLAVNLKKTTRYVYNMKKIGEEMTKMNPHSVKTVEDLAKSIKKVCKENKKKDTRTPKPWWSDKVDEAWKNKTEARRNFNRNSTQENLIEFKRRAALFQRAKRDETKKKFENFPNEITPFDSSKELWAKVGRLTGKRVYKKENNILLDDRKMAEEFLDVHFGKNDPQESNFMQPWSTPQNKLLDKSKWDDILSTKKNKSAPGVDSITYEMLKQLNPKVTENIIQDLNNMWMRGTINDELKVIKVVAIPKPGRDQSTPQGKRPISLVPTITKITNTAVLERLQRHLEDNHILPQTCFGFRKKLSTNTALAYVTNAIQKNKREKWTTALICVDLSNAFNAVNTEKLLNKMTEINVSPDITNWVSSFLQNRCINFQMRDITLKRVVNNGLPQGDVLSPTLFNIYTMNLHEIHEEDVILVQFADDFGILIRAKSLERLNVATQDYMDKFVDVASTLDFTINPEKTKAILFLNSNKELDLKINGQKVETVRSHRYLGVTIDRGLGFGVHNRELQRKLTDRLNMIKVISGIKKGAHPQVMSRIYETLIRSTMEYGCVVHNNASKTSRNKLLVTSNQCLRKVTGCTKTTPLNALMAIAGQEPISIRQEYVANRFITRCIEQDNILAKELKELNEELMDKYTFMEKGYIKHRSIFDNIMICEKFHETREVQITPEMEGMTTAKRDSNPIRLKQMALFMMNSKYNGKQRIFTDASKEGCTCSVGIYVERWKRRHHFKLEQESSITAAEITAIRIAMSIIKDCEMKGAVVFTDSRSACIMLETVREDKEGPAGIVEILNIAQEWGTSIQWIPSHVAIEGNEIADSLAKLGLGDDAPIYRNQLFAADALHRFKLIKDQQTEEWYQEYSTEKGKRFHEIQPQFSSKPWYTNKDLPGADIRIINRLMTGHDFSKYWLAKMRIVANDECEICEEPETSDHLIMHCPRLGLIRSKFEFELKFRSLCELLKTKNMEWYREIIDFVRQAKLNL